MKYSPKWLNTFKRHADAARENVKEETKVGACLIGSNNEILLTAYNGPPINVEDKPERRSRKDGLKYKYAAHAERNLISFAARNGIKTEGLTVYSTHYPCSACAGAIIQAGIKCIIVGYGEFKSADGDIEHSANMFREAQVEIIKHPYASAGLDKADLLAQHFLKDLPCHFYGSIYYRNRAAMYALMEVPYISEDVFQAIILYGTKAAPNSLLDRIYLSADLTCDEAFDEYASIQIERDKKQPCKEALQVNLAILYASTRPEVYHEAPEDVLNGIQRMEKVRNKLCDYYHQTYERRSLQIHKIFLKSLPS